MTLKTSLQLTCLLAVVGALLLGDVRAFALTFPFAGVVVFALSIAMLIFQDGDRAE